ncbi:MAG: hypothetical protein NC324_10095 [Bacteroides sp.]|nr:hypothetical protein [Bacteroides sp.]
MGSFGFKTGRAAAFLLGVFCLVQLFSCREEYRKFEKGEVYLRFSQDTIRFDTILSTQTSVTKVITVRNLASRAVTISRVYLAGGAGSRFRFNLNGDTALVQRNLVLGGKDSLYLFVQTVLDYRGQDDPFEVTDYLRFELNGMAAQQVVLSAWGQDAHYWQGDRSIRVPYRDPLQGSFYEEDSLSFRYFLWNETDYPIADRKPYVIYGYLTVSEGKTLELPAGTRLYFANNSGIWMQAGSRLQISGTIEDPVIFTSLRQDGSYRNMAGQWGRVWLDSASGPHTVDYAVVRNGQTAFWIDPDNGNGTQIANTRIENMDRHGIMARNVQVEGVNLCIGESQVNLCLSGGGDYSFTHCTFANDYYGGMIGVYNRCLYLSNKDGEGRTAGILEGAKFNNSIFYGRNSRQLEIDLDSAGAANMLFTRCLIKYEPAQSSRYFDSCRWNGEPFFVNADGYDFDIDTVASAAVGLGDPAFAQGKAELDLKGRLRSNPPAAGAYEFYPKENTPLWRWNRKNR